MDQGNRDKRPRGTVPRLWALLAFSLYLALPASAFAQSSLTLSQAQLGNIFTSSQVVQIPVQTTGDSVSWTCTDFFGAVTSGGPIPVSSQQATIQPNLGRLGYFALQVTAYSSGSVLASANTTFAVLAPTSLQTMTDSPFGICTHFAQGWPTDVMPLIALAGIANYRDEQYWQNVEPTLTSPPSYTFPANFQAYTDTAAGLGLTLALEADFANTNYDGGNTPYDTTGYTGYAGYVAAVLAHYGSETPSITIWNEYDGSYCQGPATADRPGYYTAMLQAAYQSAKAAAPNVTVVGGACVPLPLPWFQSLFADGALDYMDAVDIHPYVDPPEGLETSLASLQSLMVQYNHGAGPKPIWATECGYVDTVNPGRQAMSSYLVRIMTIMRSAGVSNAFWYLLYDASDSNSGLLHAPGDPLGTYVPSSGYPAYANLIAQLYGATFVQREATDSRTRFYCFTRTTETQQAYAPTTPGPVTKKKGATRSVNNKPVHAATAPIHVNPKTPVPRDTETQQVHVLWSTEGTAQLVLGVSAPATLVNIMGETTTLTPTNGLIAVTADLNPVYVIGTIQSIREVGRDDLVADSIRDFSATQGAAQGSWIYGYYDGDITAYPADFASASFKQMTYTELASEYAWTGPYYDLIIDTDGAEPSTRPVDPNNPSGAYTQVWAVRRWLSNAAGTAHITGSVSRSSTGGDGTTASIYVDGVQVYSQTVTTTATVQIDLQAPINVGSDVDFVATPGPGNDINYDYVSFPVSISVPAPPATTFEAWQDDYFSAEQIVDPTVSDESASPAGDGLPNLLKYAFGFDPFTPEVSPVVVDISTGYLRLTAPLNSAATDLTYSVQVTGDLTNPSGWTTAGTTVDQESASLLQVHDDIAVASSIARFIRLQVQD